MRIRETLKLPLFYLLLLGAFAAWQAFFNLHLDRIGFNSMQIGALNAVFISTSALVVPFWGMLADKYGNYRVLLLLTSVCALMVFLIGETLTFYWMLVFVACYLSFSSTFRSSPGWHDHGFCEESFEDQLCPVQALGIGGLCSFFPGSGLFCTEKHECDFYHCCYTFSAAFNT